MRQERGESQHRVPPQAGWALAAFARGPRGSTVFLGVCSYIPVGLRVLLGWAVFDLPLGLMASGGRADHR